MPNGSGLERSAALSLIDPIIGPASAFGGPNPLADASRRRKNVLPSHADAIARYSSKPPMNTWHPAVLDAYVEHGFTTRHDGSIALKCPGEIEATVYEASGATDVFEHLHELDFEVLLVTSEHSNVRHLPEAQRARFRNVRYHVIDDATHFIPQEKPEEVTQLVLEWFGVTSNR